MRRAPTAQPALPADLKLGNRMQVMEVFKTGGEYTANAISEQIGLSRQTVMKAIQFFVDKGIVVSTGKGDSTSIGGKRPELFSLAFDKFLLCIEIWPCHLRFVLLDLRFNMIDQLLLKQRLPADSGHLLSTVGEISASLLQHNQIHPDHLYGVSVSTPGIVNYQTNSLKFNSLSPAWGANIPIAEALRPYFLPETPILVENVGKMTARSLLHKRELQDKRILVVFSSWGVSGSFIERDRILHGKNSLIGEIGHMILEPNDSERCGCGGCGCFERLVSNDHLRGKVTRTIGAHPASMLNRVPMEELTVETVFAASAQGDAYARSLVSDLARYFAMALRNITLVFDPNLVVFYGDFAYADDHFQQEFKRQLSEFQYYPEEGPFQLELDRHPIEDLDLRGSYVLLLDHIFSAPALYE